MYNRALAGFVRGLLGPLGLERAPLDTFHGWALAAVQRGYKGELQLDLAPAEGDEAATEAKKHVGMLAAIDELVAQQTRSADAYLAAKLSPYAETGAGWLDRWRQTPGPLVRRLVRCRAEALVARDEAKGLVAQRLTEIHKVFVAAVTRATLYKDELRRMLTDVPTLTRHLTGLAPATIEALAANQRALSARGASERRAGPSVRFDDLALLLRLMQVKNGGLPDQRDESVSTFEHLVIDEAQDFGAVELAVLLGAVRSRTGVTIVGDLNQKIVPSADFVGWSALARELGVEGVEVCALTVGHRATGPIMALADHIIDDAPSGGRAGQAPRLLRPVDTDAAVDAIAEEVFAVLADDPRAHIALVTRHRGAVAPLVAALSRALDGLCAVREGHNKEFSFAPGLTVTNYRQVKGLEFDAVIVHEPTEDAYPADVQGRRDLYTVLTRARDRLVLVCVDPPSSLLTAAAAAGLVDVPEADQVPSAELGALDEPL
jgi:DNA helicase-2/ATP-dependent DNA helicase PcrA